MINTIVPGVEKNEMSDDEKTNLDINIALPSTGVEIDETLYTSEQPGSDVQTPGTPGTPVGFGQTNDGMDGGEGQCSDAYEKIEEILKDVYKQEYTDEHL